jgi:hypothetical protein
VDYLQTLVFKYLKRAILRQLPPTDEIYTFTEVGAGYLKTETTDLQKLGVKSRYLPYIFLVDSKGFVRWRTDGEFKEESMQYLYPIHSICGKLTKCRLKATRDLTTVNKKSTSK